MARPVVTLNKDCFLIGENVSVRDCDRQVQAFLGIPYAEAPIGNRRFRPPEKLKLWSGFREAKEYGPACPQDAKDINIQLPSLPVVYDEDCLYLNVWSPDVNTTIPLPVMVWIHGGAFVQGFSNNYDGASLAAFENVIVVSLNYRLGVFGFLRTGADSLDYQGNQGLLDQLEALRWVQTYINCFGGNASNVTVFGESAGGMSISYHLQSPMAQGLFQKAIIQSGPGLAFNSLWPAKAVEKFWWKRIHSLNFKGTSSKDLIVFLENQTTDALLRVFNDWFVPPVIDDIYAKGNSRDLYEAGRFQRVDCIIGFNSSEGVLFVPDKIANQEEAENFISSLITKSFFRNLPHIVTGEIMKFAKAHYVDSENYVRGLSNFYGDFSFVAPSLHQAQLHSAKARTYLYEFDHRPFFSQDPSWVCANHTYEIPYMFGYPFLNWIPHIWPEHDRELSKSMMRYWTNFARTGNPNGMDDDQPLWHQFNSDNQLYMKIQSTEITSQRLSQLQLKRAHLWNYTVPQIIEQYNQTRSKY